MVKRKENSTNTINEIYWKENCGLTRTLSLIGGRWKINILSFLFNEKILRYSELRKRLQGISERMLIAKLKELEKDGLITRVIYHEVPPKVEYSLTETGLSLGPIIGLMDRWGEAH
jgi:DNA-binding HxlR family transcriptional regulator